MISLRHAAGSHSNATFPVGLDTSLDHVFRPPRRIGSHIRASSEKYAPLLNVSLSNTIEAKCTQGGHTPEYGQPTRPAQWKVPLILHSFKAPRRGHIPMKVVVGQRVRQDPTHVTDCLKRVDTNGKTMPSLAQNECQMNTWSGRPTAR